MALSAVLLFHVGEALNGLGEFFDGGIGVPVLDAVAHAVLDVSFQHHLAHAVQGRLAGVDLCEYVLTGNVLINHAIHSLYLTDDFFQTCVHAGGIGVRTLAHGFLSLVYFFGFLQPNGHERKYPARGSVLCRRFRDVLPPASRIWKASRSDMIFMTHPHALVILRQVFLR